MTGKRMLIRFPEEEERLWPSVLPQGQRRSASRLQPTMQVALHIAWQRH